MPLVKLPLPLIAGKDCFLCIDDHTDITIVLVGGKDGLVLALEDH